MNKANYYTIWDSENEGFVKETHNTTNEYDIKNFFLSYISEGISKDVLKQISSLSINELAELVGMEVRDNYEKFPSNVTLLSYDSDTENSDAVTPMFSSEN